MCQALFQLLEIKNQTEQRVPTLYRMRTHLLIVQRQQRPGGMNTQPTVTRQASSRAGVRASPCPQSRDLLTTSSPCPLLWFSQRHTVQSQGEAACWEEHRNPPFSRGAVGSSGVVPEPTAPFFRSLVMNNCFLPEPRPVTSG